ncbi:ZNF76 [Cordylochernes scorpioides]|uniref:ZNF76 n=1 Tax=Cordylochernes scorpioides TaxID=51811 RepID=A0ABY6LJQ8_9ARAC|nr:ZNF76 [Cordylochernes scorpioides]
MLSEYLRAAAARYVLPKPRKAGLYLDSQIQPAREVTRKREDKTPSCDIFQLSVVNTETDGSIFLLSKHSWRCQGTGIWLDDFILICFYYRLKINRERPFKCTFEGCDRAFTTSNIRKVHVRTHTGEKPYTCKYEGCGRAFASATNYKNHIRIHTEIESINNREVMYKRTGELGHTANCPVPGEKPYQCPITGCQKRFTEYSSLYKHHVVHTHSQPYSCELCGRNYRQTSTLALHKRTSHNIFPESPPPWCLPAQLVWRKRSPSFLKSWVTTVE